MQRCRMPVAESGYCCARRMADRVLAAYITLYRWASTSGRCAGPDIVLELSTPSTGQAWLLRMCLINYLDAIRQHSCFVSCGIA